MVVVDEGNHALLAKNHLPENRPVVHGHGCLGWLVDIVDQSGGSDRDVELNGCDERVAIGVFVAPVIVSEEDGDHVEGMGFDPGSNLTEVVLHRAFIEKIAGGMAVVQRAIGVVGLSLQHADAIVELLCYRVLLVTCRIVLTCEGRVMCANFGYVGILPAAELDIVVARLGI